MSKSQKQIQKNSTIEAKLFAPSITASLFVLLVFSLQAWIFCITFVSVCHLPHFLIEKNGWKTEGKRQQQIDKKKGFSIKINSKKIMNNSEEWNK